MPCDRALFSLATMKDFKDKALSIYIKKVVKWKDNKILCNLFCKQYSECTIGRGVMSFSSLKDHWELCGYLETLLSFQIFVSMIRISAEHKFYPWYWSATPRCSLQNYLSIINTMIYYFTAEKIEPKIVQIFFFITTCRETFKVTCWMKQASSNSLFLL